MVKIKINELKAHPFNKIFGDLPEEEFEALKNDIQIRGMQSNIDITEDNVIVCGHQRVKACNQLGIKDIDARVLKGWSEEQVKEHLIKDNVLRRQLTWVQVVEAGKELKKIYVGRQGSNQYKQKGSLPTNVGNQKHDRETSTLVAKDFGISGRTYERYEKIYDKAKKQNPNLIKEAKEDNKTVSQICKELEPLEEPCTKANAQQKKLVSNIQTTISTITETKKFMQDFIESDLDIIESALKRLQNKLFELHEELETQRGALNE